MEPKSAICPARRRRICGATGAKAFIMPFRFTSNNSAVFVRSSTDPGDAVTIVTPALAIRQLIGDAASNGRRNSRMADGVAHVDLADRHASAPAPSRRRHLLKAS